MLSYQGLQALMGLWPSSDAAALTASGKGLQWEQELFYPIGQCYCNVVIRVCHYF